MSGASWTGRAWSSTVRLVVTDPRALRPASQDLQSLLARVDAAASRFRADSALSRANAHAGRPVPVPALLADLVDAALGAAAQTDGAVDPALGRAMHRLGYDRDIAEVRGAVRTAVGSPTHRAGGWRRVRVHREAGLLTVPAGHALDLGATAKAWTADHAAATLAARYGTGVLVELGGDLAVAGPALLGGWRVRVAEREGGPGQVVVLHHGGLATSTTTLRRWTCDGQPVHHIVDPATGRAADGPWRTVTVHAPTALAANVASTEAIVRGADALARLARPGHAARLVARDGTVTTTGIWPTPSVRSLAGAA